MALNVEEGLREHRLVEEGGGMSMEELEGGRVKVGEPESVAARVR